MAFTAKIDGLDKMVAKFERRKKALDVEARAFVDIFLDMAKAQIRELTPVAHDFKLEGASVTEVEGGTTRELWRVSPAEGKQNVGMVDHPYNEPGAVHTDARGRERVANNGRFNLLFVLEYGSKPHPIAAKSPDKPLRFYWEREDVIFEGGVVNHPGSFGTNGPPPRMVHTTFLDTEPKFRVTAAEWLEEVFA
jgi:hypothetical protein